MDPKHWQQIDKLLEAALDRDPRQREAFLEEACAGDEDLRQKVKALLIAHDQAGSFGETPALELAARALAEQPVRSLVGKRLGPYEILSLIGRGGMGEVYRVRDTRLDRIDALKVLPVEVAADAERIRRFVREAHAASALNHPNIATIYEIGESEVTHWIAMELVEGQTLAEWLSDRSPAVEEILDIGIQTADALGEAHRRGIIHRDIKPANLMITSEGRVKVLDFGLAKIKRSEGPAAAVTVSSQSHTLPGIVMGTARYMSPEQVLGQAVDHRTDIFSLGTVLYEMAVGQPPFAGETSSAIFDAIVHQTVAWPPRQCATIPEELRRIVYKSLEKFREMRYQSAANLCADLKHLKHELARGRLTAQPAGIAAPTQPGQKVVLQRTARVLALAGILGILILGAIVIWSLKSRLASTPETPLTAIPLTSYPGGETGASFSPDGNQVAFAWNGEKEDNWDIYVQLIGSNQHLRLTTNPARDTWPAWSPDGRQIAFCRDLGLGKRAVILISPLGGPERTLTEVTHRLDWEDEFFGPFLSWSPDSRALAMVDGLDTHTNPGLALYMMETGEKYHLTKPALIDSCPAFSPDGRTLAFCRRVAWANSDLYLLDLSQDLKPVGGPRRLTFQSLSTSGLPWMSSGGVAWVSDGRTLIYSAGGSLWRVASSASGQPQKLASLGQEAGSPAISPRGSRLAYTHTSSDSDIWRIEFSSPEGKVSPPAKFISSTRFEMGPRYSPDGNKIAFTSDQSGSWEIWVCDADGSNAVQLTHFGRGFTGDNRWSPDGSHVTFDSNIEGHPEVYVVNVSGGNPRRLTFSSGSENPSWSKDGRWIYFNSMESSIQKVRAEGGPVVLVTRKAPGSAPVESADGKSIFVTGPNQGLWSVPVEGGESRQVLESLASFDAYEVTDDGTYFIPGPDSTKGYSIRFLDLVTGEIKIIAKLGKMACGGLAISPDRRWALYAQINQSGSDLMLVENFR